MVNLKQNQEIQQATILQKEGEQMININDIDMTEAAYNFILKRLEYKENIINAIESEQLVEADIDGEKALWYQDSEIKQKDWAVYNYLDCDTNWLEVDLYHIKYYLHDTADGGKRYFDETLVDLLDGCDLVAGGIDIKENPYELYAKYRDTGEKIKMTDVRLLYVTKEYVEKAGNSSNMYEGELVLVIEDVENNKWIYIPTHYDREDEIVDEEWVNCILYDYNLRMIGYNDEYESRYETEQYFKQFDEDEELA